MSRNIDLTDVRGIPSAIEENLLVRHEQQHHQHRTSRRGLNNRVLEIGKLALSVLSGIAIAFAAGSLSRFLGFS